MKTLSMKLFWNWNFNNRSCIALYHALTLIAVLWTEPKQRVEYESELLSPDQDKIIIFILKLFLFNIKIISCWIIFILF